MQDDKNEDPGDEGLRLESAALDEQVCENMTRIKERVSGFVVRAVWFGQTTWTRHTTHDIEKRTQLPGYVR